MSTIYPRFPRTVAVFRGLPGPLLAGLATLGAGLLLDLAVHVAGGDHAGDSTAALAVHGVVLLGMALSVAGLARAAFPGRGPAGAHRTTTTRRFER